MNFLPSVEMKFNTNSIETDIDFIKSLAHQSFQRLPQLRDHSHFTGLLAWVERVTKLGLQVCSPFSGVSFPFGNQHLTNELWLRSFHVFSSFSYTTFTSGPAMQICYRIFGLRHERRWSGSCVIALGAQFFHCAWPALWHHIPRGIWLHHFQQRHVPVWNPSSNQRKHWSAGAEQR